MVINRTVDAKIRKFHLVSCEVCRACDNKPEISLSRTQVHIQDSAFRQFICYKVAASTQVYMEVSCFKSGEIQRIILIFFANVI